MLRFLLYDDLHTSGCGSQHPLRVLYDTRVLLAAAPTSAPCFCRRQRSPPLHQAVRPHFRKEVKLMPITLTFHIFGLVFTIKVKSENRHPGR